MTYTWIPYTGPVPTLGTIVNAILDGQCYRALVVASKPGQLLVTQYRLTPVV